MIKKHKLHGVMELSRDISYTGSIMLTKHSPLTRIFTRGDLVSLYMLQLTLLLSLLLRLFMFLLLLLLLLIVLTLLP